MLRSLVALPIVVLLLGLIMAGVAARNGPTREAVPPAAGITEVGLGQIDPAAAAGSRLEVVEQRWAPAAFATQHVHPAALITCVQAGALGFSLQHGAATLTRSASLTSWGKSEPVLRQTPVILRPGDCIAFDEFAVHTEHTAWNASDGPTILWEARLRDPRRPFTDYVDAARLLEPRNPFVGSENHASDSAR